MPLVAISGDAYIAVSMESQFFRSYACEPCAPERSVIEMAFK